ncbi:flavin reductase family protein [Micromonospora sp. B11E3]|uniref:flavin reductase family protein n=1 Tax=Micromonospora sp. B11E3 TaxID=3153562 RepID=UPI00325E8CFD
MLAVELRPVDRELFRALLSRRTATATVVTAPGLAAHRGRPPLPPTACTATSLTAVSLEPPLVSFCLAGQPSSRPAIERAEHLAVHLIPTGQWGATATSAGDLAPLAADPGWQPGPFGVPLLDGALAVLLCRAVHQVPAGDHTLVVAEPLALGAGEERYPLTRDPAHTTAGRPDR